MHTLRLPLGAHWGGSDGSKCQGSLETEPASVAIQPLFKAQMGQSPGPEAAPVSWACGALLPSLLCGRKMTSNTIRMMSRPPPTTNPKQTRQRMFSQRFFWARVLVVLLKAELCGRPQKQNES